MIIDLENTSFTLPSSNTIIIVGAGPVGIYLAHCLTRAGKSVVIIEAGSRVASSARNEVGTNSVGFEYDGHKLGREFGLGGTSVVWGGQLVELERADFSRWPLTYEDVCVWYRKVYDDLSVYPAEVEVYRNRLGAERPEEVPQAVERFFSHWLPQQNFARLFKKEVIDNPRTPVLINGTVCAVRVPEGRAESVTVRTADQRVLEIPGGQFIFCNGTLEIVRFFLSTAKNTNVPWKNNRSIGKFYQDHLCGTAATATVIDETRFRDFFENAFTSRLVKLQPRLRPRADVRESDDVGVCGFFSFRSDIQDHLGNIKWLIRSLRSGAQFSTLSSLPKDTLSLVRMFTPIARRFIRDRRVMAFFDQSLELMVQCEQRPLEQSQIRLRTDEHTVPGLFAIDIDWQLDERQTIDAVNRFTRDVDSYLRERGLASLIVDERVVSSEVSFLKSMTDIYHHAGGMCMSESSDLGVVDTDCRVWGTSNIYVAGASVFPSSGYANPTLTALAIAARLASSLSAVQ
jgi:GMC oxidoreductase/putative NAD(P)-binding protein